MKKLGLKHPIPLQFVIYVCGLFILLPAYSQMTPGLQETRQSSSNQNTFSYRIQTTYGTSTSAQVSGNMKAETEAVLRLKSGTKVTNKIGDNNGNASAVFVATPTGGNVALTGITGENMFFVDDGTFFRSALTSGDSQGSSGISTGSASATATHTTTVTVEKGSTEYQNYFQQTF
ncbi:hypothetical protein KBY58_11370 [Cyanobium sp. HWJ4-Hawea]|nr:hypothetical protein [Cyanobium sp. HWJ4-Hawea]